MPVSTAVCTELMLLIKWEKLDFDWGLQIIIGTAKTFIISVTSHRIMAFIK